MELLIVRCWAREATHQSTVTCTHVLKDWGQYFTAPVQSCVCEKVDIPQKRTRSTSKTHLNGMTECWGRHLQRVLSAGNSGLWIVFTTSQCEGPPYLRCWAESVRSAIVLWLFGIYLVIRPFKSNGGMKALALLNLPLLVYFVSRELLLMAVHQHSLVLLFRADHLNRFELPLVSVDLWSYLIDQRKAKLPSATR